MECESPTLKRILTLSTVKPEDHRVPCVRSLSTEELRKLLAHWTLYNVEYLYECVPEATYKTLVVPLDREICQLVAQANYREPVLQLPSVRALCQQLDAMIQAVGGVAFVRLSTRSPKDAVLVDDERVDKYIISALKQSLAENDNDENKLNISLWTGMLQAMQVNNGEDAMKLILLSERTSKDCDRELNLEGDLYQMKVIVREWKPSPISHEFRTFVTKRKINGITQYFDNCYFADVVVDLDSLVSKIIAFWSTISDKLPYQDAIVDFAVLQERVYVIETNPFDELTGSGLFDYKDDWEILTGQAPFEVRVFRSPHEPLLCKRLEADMMSFRAEIRKAKNQLKPPSKSEESKKTSKDENCLLS